MKLLFKSCGNPQPGSLKNVSKSIFNEDETQPIWNHDDTFWNMRVKIPKIIQTPDFYKGSYQMTIELSQKRKFTLII